MTKDLEYYKDCFSSLNTMKKCGKPAPHKALLLLSIIDLIERGVITDCRVPLSDDLVRQFKRNTSALLGESKLFQPVANYPYYHMKSEPFWQLVANSNCQIDKISNYSLPNLRANIAYARIDEELFNLLQNPNVRAKLRVTLITKYLDNQPTFADKLKTMFICMGYITAMIA